MLTLISLQRVQLHLHLYRMVGRPTYSAITLPRDCAAVTTWRQTKWWCITLPGMTKLIGKQLQLSDTDTLPFAHIHFLSNICTINWCSHYKRLEIPPYKFIRSCCSKCKRLTFPASQYFSLPGWNRPQDKCTCVSHGAGRVGATERVC